MHFLNQPHILPKVPKLSNPDKIHQILDFTSGSQSTDSVSTCILKIYLTDDGMTMTKTQLLQYRAIQRSVNSTFCCILRYMIHALNAELVLDTISNNLWELWTVYNCHKPLLCCNSYLLV